MKSMCVYELHTYTQFDYTIIAHFIIVDKQSVYCI